MPAIVRISLASLSICFVVFASSALAQPRDNRVYGPRRPTLPANKQQAPPTRGGAAGPLVQTGPPPGFQLSEAQSRRINQMLEYWEKKTSDINTFRTEFVRWSYDPVFGPKDGKARAISRGEIRYAAPDRGMIKETEVYEYDDAKAKKGEKWPYTKSDSVGEHWVCDGKSVFEFHHATKQLIETKLPAEMQGDAIANGPLPFMFGAQAESIRGRYWIRELAREAGKDKPYRLELIPKGRGEDFSKVTLHLDAVEFLPEVMEIHGLNAVSKSTYQFNKRGINHVKDNLQNFMNSFVSPRKPSGWTKFVRDVGQPPESEAAGPRQAQGTSPSPR